jgi:small neutral amino acid transporter SnatA (MarC family)
MPSLAGPGTILTIVLLSDNDRHDLWGQATTVLVLLGLFRPSVTRAPAS